MSATDRVDGGEQISLNSCKATWSQRWLPHNTTADWERNGFLCSQSVLFRIRCSVSTVVAWIAEATETAGILTLRFAPAGSSDPAGLRRKATEGCTQSAASNC